MTHPAVLVGYLLLFAAAAFVFVLVSLAIGRLLRAWQPTPEKQQTYECGEPSVGSAYVRFDLRFYVVALLFIVFDVEIAFFFPWAVVFGKTSQLVTSAVPMVAWAGHSAPESVAAGSGAIAQSAMTPPAQGPRLVLPAEAERRLRELGVPRPGVPEPGADAETNRRIMHGAFRKLGLGALIDIGVFFGVLLVGFAYLWYQGDLEWVRPVRWRGELCPAASSDDLPDRESTCPTHAG